MLVSTIYLMLKRWWEIDDDEKFGTQNFWINEEIKYEKSKRK